MREAEMAVAESRQPALVNSARQSATSPDDHTQNHRRRIEQEARGGPKSTATVSTISRLPKPSGPSDEDACTAKPGEEPQATTAQPSIPWSSAAMNQAAAERKLPLLISPAAIAGYFTALDILQAVGKVVRWLAAAAEESPPRQASCEQVV